MSGKITFKKRANRIITFKIQIIYNNIILNKFEKQSKTLFQENIIISDGKMCHWIEAFATKPENLSSIPRLTQWKERTKLSSDLLMYATPCMNMHTHTIKNCNEIHFKSKK